MKETEAKRTRLLGMFIGFCKGLLGGLCVAGFGVLLSLTGIGAIIGIPLIVFGFLAPLFMMLGGFHRLFGECPHCGKPLSAHLESGVTCEACQKRVVVNGNRFTAVE